MNMRRRNCQFAIILWMLWLPTLAWSEDDSQSMDFEKVHWQQAAADDIHVFDPYIGKFKSKTFHDEQQNKDFHYLIEYRWFDTRESIVQFTVSTVVPADEKEVINVTGFYGFDPFQSRLYAYAFFPSGMTGFGGVSSFDRETHQRITRAQSQGPDGSVTQVRDEFELVDADTWRNVTYISRSGEDWKVAYQDTYTRIEDAEPN